MSTNILSLIEEKMANMSKSHKLLGKYIIDHSEKAVRYTATKLGEEIGVSESTVVRFATELGFKGYSELQDALKNVIHTKLTTLQRIDVYDEASCEDVLGSVMSNDIENLRISMNKIDREEFEKVADLIAYAKNIYILGLRTSSVLANFLYYYLDLLIENVNLVNTSGVGEIYEQLRRIGKGDVIIGITFPRYSTRTKECLRIAKNAGANVIAITDSEVSPIVPIADRILYVKSAMMSFVDSLVAPLSVMNTLIVSVGRKKKDSLKGTFNRLEQIWKEHEVYENNKE